jgi:hypothetical protein
LFSYFFITFTYHALEKIIFLGVLYSTNWNSRSAKKFVKGLLHVFSVKWCGVDLVLEIIFWCGKCVHCRTWLNPVCRVRQVVSKDTFEFSSGVHSLLIEEGRALGVPWFTGCSFVRGGSLPAEWLSTKPLFSCKI